MDARRRGTWSGPAGVVAALAAFAVALAVAPTAHAHATFVRSDPSDGSSLTRAPRVIRLWFSEPVQVGLSSVRLSDARQRAVPGLTLRAGPRGLVTVGLPDLRRGVYTLDWRALSTDDVHATTGSLAFAVRAAAPPPASPRSVPAAEASEVVLRWLGLLFLTVALGALAVVALVLTPTLRDGWASTEAALRARRRVLWLAAVAALFAVAFGPVVLYWQAAEVAATGGVLSNGWRLLSETRWGTLWLVREACSVALAVAVSLALRARPISSRALAAIAAPLALVLVATYGLTSHALGLQEDRAPAVVADSVHVLAASVWVGGLLALLVACMRPVGVRGPLGRSMLRRFGWLAAVSVGLLAATGLYTVSRQVASADALLRSTYGQALLGKSALLLAAGALGFVTWLLVNPGSSSILARWRRSRSTPRPRRGLLLAEAGLGVLVLLGAALVTSTPPARGPEYVPAAVAPSTLATTAGDLLVSVSATPNLPGQNVLTVRTAVVRRPALAGVDGVALRIAPASGAASGVDPVAARRVADATYRVTTARLAREGPWQLDVVVERSGAPDTVARFGWTVGSTTAPQRVLVSDEPLAPLALRAAGALVLLLVVGIGVALLASGARRSGGLGSSTAPRSS